MAINFLDNIQLNQNQILGARIENITSDPSTANGGDIIFNSTSGVLKYYDGTTPFSSAGWISLTADTGMLSWNLGDGSSTATITNGQEAKFAAGTGITTSLSTRTITISNSQPFNGLGLAASTGSTSTIADEGTITIAAGTGITTTSNGSGTVTIAATGSGSMSDFILTGDSGTNQTISDGDTLDIAGGTNITTVVGATDTVTVNLDDSITLAGDLTVTGGDITLGGTGRIQGVDTVTDGTDAANKTYVDNAVAGGLNVKGGFNASTGIVALTSVSLYTTTAVAVGDYYIVTTAGDFFGQASTPLTVGDSVLVQTASAAPASITDFAVIQSDTDLATAATVGIGNVNASAANNKEGLSLSYSNGTGTVGFDIKNGLSVATAVADGDAFAMFQGSTEAQGNFSITSQLMADYFGSKSSFAGTSSSGTSHVFTHNLNTADVIVQVYDASTLETVYANVDRTSVNQVTVTTAATANIRCLVQK